MLGLKGSVNEQKTFLDKITAPKDREAHVLTTLSNSSSSF